MKTITDLEVMEKRAMAEYSGQTDEERNGMGKSYCP
jgi:hypothetical protein